MISLKLSRNLLKILIENVATDGIWYHGSPHKFDSFKLKKGTFLDSNYISPIFLTSSRNFAEEYAGYMYNKIRGSDFSEIEKVFIFDWLKANGFDGAYIIETSAKNMFVFNPDKLQIIDRMSLLKQP